MAMTRTVLDLRGHHAPAAVASLFENKVGEPNCYFFWLLPLGQTFLLIQWLLDHILRRVEEKRRAAVSRGRGTERGAFIWCKGCLAFSSKCGQKLKRKRPRWPLRAFFKILLKWGIERHEVSDCQRSTGGTYGSTSFQFSFMNSRKYKCGSSLVG
jgi:hypothetical protein